MIRTANSLDDEIIKILKLLLVELKSFYLWDYQSKLLSLLENIFQEAEISQSDEKIFLLIKGEKYNISFVVKDDFGEYFIPNGKPLTGSPLLSIKELRLLNRENYVVEKTYNTKYHFYDEEKGETNLIFVIKLKSRLLSYRKFYLPPTVDLTDCDDSLFSAFIKSEVEFESQ